MFFHFFLLFLSCVVLFTAGKNRLLGIIMQISRPTQTGKHNPGVSCRPLVSYLFFIYDFNILYVAPGKERREGKEGKRFQ
ncbi:MAG: hypothetical protein BM485_04210 [Desulfobulbaceae bacterium DB1]|nr:MAG: hypothetical protein BM485_04210 [Desulfobulbaceae bacterium DB1]